MIEARCVFWFDGFDSYYGFFPFSISFWYFSSAVMTRVPMPSGRIFCVLTCITLGPSPWVAASKAEKSRSWVKTIAIFSDPSHDLPVAGGCGAHLGPLDRIQADHGKLLDPPVRQIHVNQDLHDAMGTSLSSALQAAYDKAWSTSSRSR